MAAAACEAVSVPLKAFGATTTFIGAASLIDRECPVLELLRVAAYRAEVDALQLLRELADRAVSHRAAVDLDHRGDLRPRAAQEQLLARIELGPVDAPFDHRHAQLVLDEVEDERPRHAFEDVVRDGWSEERPVLEHEQ